MHAKIQCIYCAKHILNDLISISLRSLGLTKNNLNSIDFFRKQREINSALPLNIIIVESNSRVNRSYNID